MPCRDTVVGALLEAIPREQLARLVAAHRSDKGVRRPTSRGRLVALLVAQLAGCRSLREAEAVLGSQGGALRRLGVGPVRRSTFATANATRPAALFEDLFGLPLGRLGERVPPAVGREAVRLVDATSVRLSEALHGWARRSAEHAGVKLHLVYDPGQAPPTYFTVTPCRINDIVEAERLPLEPGAAYVFDKGYDDFASRAGLDAAGCRFVTRLKRHSPTRPVEERPAEGEAILADRLVRLSERLEGQRTNPHQGVVREVLVARREGEPPLRLVGNDLGSPAEKRNLAIDRFLGRSANAVKVQLVTALIAYLLLHDAHRAASGHAPASARRFRQLVRATLWQRRPLAGLVAPPRARPPILSGLRLARALP
jgi:hypothetical protein